MSSRRIASLLPSATEIVFALGLGDRVVAVSHECDEPPKAKDLPAVTYALLGQNGTSGEIDAEVKDRLGRGEPLYGLDQRLLAELAPDLILTQAKCDVCAVRLEDVVGLTQTVPALARTRLVTLAPTSLSDVLGDCHRIAEAAGEPHLAEPLVQSLAGRVDAVRQAGVNAVTRRRVACIEWLSPLMLAGNWIPEMITIAGGLAPSITGSHHSPYVTWNEVLDFAPEVLILMPCGFTLGRTLEELTLITQLPRFFELPAVVDRRVFAVDGSRLFNRSGPKLVDSLELLATWIGDRDGSAGNGEPDVWRRIEVG